MKQIKEHKIKRDKGEKFLADYAYDKNEVFCTIGNVESAIKIRIHQPTSQITLMR